MKTKNEITERVENDNISRVQSVVPAIIVDWEGQRSKLLDKCLITPSVIIGALSPRLNKDKPSKWLAATPSKREDGS